MSRSFRLFGSVVAIAAGVLYFVYGILYSLDPVVNGEYDGPVSMMEAYIANEARHLSFHLVFALLGVALLLVVPVMATLLRSKEEDQGWVMLASILGAIGATTHTISQARFLYVEPIWHRTFLAGDAAVQANIMETLMPLLNPDPYWIFEFGALGVWMIIIGSLFLKYQVTGKVVAYAGVACGLFTILMAIGHVTHISALTLLGGVFTSAVAGPLWLIGLGITLGRGQTQRVTNVARASLPT